MTYQVCIIPLSLLMQFFILCKLTILGLLPGEHFARNVIVKMMAFDPEDRIKLVPDAIDKLESDLKSCNVI